MQIYNITYIILSINNCSVYIIYCIKYYIYIIYFVSFDQVLSGTVRKLGNKTVIILGESK